MDHNNSLNSNIATEYLEANEENVLLSDCPEEEAYTSQKRFTRTTLYLVAMVISLLGNSAIIWIVRRNRRMRNLTHFLIVNMAIADLLITIFHMPYKLQVHFTSSYAVVVGGLTGKLICKLVGYTQDVSIACSVLSLMGISVDRFMAVVFPFKHALLCHKARYAVIPIWVVSFFICSPLLYANRMEEFEGDFYCYEEWSPLLDPLTGGRNYTIIQFSLFYAVPLTVITVLYSCVAFRVWHRKIPGHAASRLRRAPSHSATKKKLLRMLIIIVCLFAACWLPYHVVFFLQFSSDKYLHCNISETIMFYCLFVGHANSAVNPCIYFAIHKEYRKGLIQVTRSICCQLGDVNYSGCLLRRFSSLNLQPAPGRAERTDCPTSFPEMSNRKRSLEWNQVVVTRVTAMYSDHVL